MTDPRASAWLSSMEHLRTVQKYIEKYGRYDPTDQVIRPQLDAARTLAILASVPTDVAKAVIAIEYQKAHDREQAESRLAEVFGEKNGAS